MELTAFLSNFKQHIENLPSEEYSDSLKSVVSDLKSFLQEITEADKAMVNQILTEFESQPGDPLFHEVGKLLRKFHDQLVMIREGIPTNLGKLANQDVAEMSSRLQHIIDMTDKAANTTLDKAEEAIEELGDLQTQYQKMQEKLNGICGDGPTSPEQTQTLNELSAQIQEFSEKNSYLQSLMTDILVAQDYQDLTGQIIKKMIDLLKVLEDELAALVKRFGQPAETIVENDQGSLKGPLNDDDDQKSSQDDVDALLNQFGF